MNTIAGIPADAPMFRPASPEELESIMQDWRDASYHYADDSGKEWGLGRKKLQDAAAKINQLGLYFDAIKALYQHAKPLMALDQVVDAVIKGARK